MIEPATNQHDTPLAPDRDGKTRPGPERTQRVQACSAGALHGSSVTGRPLTAVSLFSGGGIGDLALRGSGIEVLVASELLEDRAEVFRANFPQTAMVVGDIRETKTEVLRLAEGKLVGRELDILFATPPCQGMSKNGRGKLLNGIRAGLKPSLDERNALALEAVNLAIALDPKLIVFENVPEMEYTLVERPDGSVGDLLETISATLSPRYVGRWEVVEFADYGVPQRRQRLITVFSRVQPLVQQISTGLSVLPPRTHSAHGNLFAKAWVTVDEALEGTPPLDASTKESATHGIIPFHRVPVLDADKYFWVRNTPEGRSAFDNQCVNPNCVSSGNATHISRHDENGINRPSRLTPLRCTGCGELLPRPWVVEGGVHRLMSGFTSAYKRMRGDLPASALTRNLSYACSDQKLHPTENRVLSLYEAFILHTVSSYDFVWRRADGKRILDKTVREIIGESIPPKGLEVIFGHLARTLRQSSEQRPLTEAAVNQDGPYDPMSLSSSGR